MIESVRKSHKFVAPVVVAGAVAVVVIVVVVVVVVFDVVGLIP